MQHSCTSPELATSTPPHADSRMIRRRLSDKDLNDLDNPKHLKRLTSAHLEALALDGLKSLLQARGFHLVTHVTSMTKNERKTSAPGYKKNQRFSVLNQILKCPFPILNNGFLACFNSLQGNKRPLESCTCPDKSRGNRTK